MYGSRLTEVMVISSALLNVERTSRFSFSIASGWVSKRYVTPFIKVEVVSDPAIIKNRALALNWLSSRC